MGVTNFDQVFNFAGELHPNALHTEKFYSAGGQTTGVKKSAALMNIGGVITDVRIRLDTAPVGSTFIVDVNLNGTTIFTTQGNRPTIADGANVSTFVLPDVVTVAPGDRLSYDIDQIGSGTAGSDLYVVVTVKRATVN